MPQEDGVIHRDTQLQNCRKGFCDIGDRSEEDIRSKVVENCHSDACEKQKRNQPAVHRQHQYHNRERHCHHDVDRRFCLGEVFRINEYGTHAGQEAPLICECPDFPYCGDCAVRAGRIIEENEHHRAVAGIECVIDLIRKDLHRHTDIECRIIPDDILDAVDFHDLFFQRLYIFLRHSLTDQCGETSGPKFFFQDVLSDHCLDVFRQIRKQVVVDLCLDISKGGRY